jgi:hypothetical protein
MKNERNKDLTFWKDKNKFGQHFAKLTKRKREIQTNKISNEKGNILKKCQWKSEDH